MAGFTGENKSALSQTVKLYASLIGSLRYVNG